MKLFRASQRSVVVIYISKQFWRQINLQYDQRRFFRGLLIQWSASSVCHSQCEIPRIKTRGIWGEGKGKKDPQQGSPRCTHRQRREKTARKVYSTSVGSAALPGSEASNYTYTKVQRKTTEGTREKIKGISSTPTGQTREREWRRRERERELGLGSGVKGWGLSCWSCAYDRDSCHVSGCGQSFRHQSTSCAKNHTKPVLCSDISIVSCRTTLWGVAT